MIQMTYTEADALAVLDNLGPAYRDESGRMIESGEWVAALYESYAADQDYMNHMIETYGGQDAYALPPFDSMAYYLGQYADAAMAVAERLEMRDLEAAYAEDEFPSWTETMKDAS
jgi:hypothetical protein